MKQKYFFSMMLIICGLLLPGLQAQQITVTGVVTSAAEGDITLPGVTVMVEGTSRGAITDLDGRYEIQANPDDVLVFSFVGMTPQSIPVDGRSVINVSLEMAVAELGEIVVTGYGTESRRLISGSVGVVSEEEMRESSLRTIDGVLQGRSAGVQITQSSGTPGAANAIRIRGNSSISAGNQPLVVVDGIPVTTGNFGQVGFSGQGIDALSDINPNDIQSITVLKDASAAAIYGARATNGVILITTKRGAKQPTTLSFNATLGLQDLENRLDMLNAEQWHDLKGTQPADPANMVNTDWLSEVLRTAPTMNYELSARGGDENTRFFVSGNYYNQEGILLGTSYERLSSRVNLDHIVNERFDIGMSFGVSYALNNRVEGDQSLNAPLANAIANPAIYPVYNEDGSYNEEAPFANPVAIGKEAINEAHSYRTLGNIFGNYRILKNLTFSTKWGIDYLSLREHSYDPATTRQGARSNGIGLEAQSNVLNLVSNNTFRYVNTFGEHHNTELLGGYSFEMFQRRNSFIRGVDFPNPYFQYVSEAGVITGASANATDRGINSFFGQVRYNYNFRYILSLTARYDGSSRFGEENRYGFFPAVSAAWRISEEDFFKNWNTPINEMRIRGGYGITGNDGIPDFAYLALFGGGANYLGRSGIFPRGIPNPDLKWETTYQYSAGLDMGLYNDRLEITVDYYYNHTKDLLFSRPIPFSSGHGSITSNIGELENRGIEFSLSTVNIENRVFSWTSSFNISRNRNKVLALYNDQPLDNIGRGSNSVRVGEPIGIFYGYKSLGVDPSTGDIVFADINGDGQITAEDRTKIGDPNPDFTGGLSNRLTYQNFELSVFLQFSYGNDIFNGTRIYIESMKGSDNQTTAVLDRWRQPGDETNIPRATELDPNNNNRISSRFIEDGSYLRVKNLTLSYQLDRSLANRLGMSSARVFVTGQNLLTFTNYSGMDPEVNYAGPSDLVLGTDFFTHPQVRTVSFGVSIEM
ncbi:MAG: TonB-dependent receptor [Bacteroidia bacterium]|nr:MAG: TonB-dependent receptor [Bacteroidia bacterium]